MEKKNTVKIAKGGTKKAATARKLAKRKPATRKPARKPVAKKLTPMQERDLKAKQKVEELLKDSTFTQPKEDDLIILDEEPKGIDWLQEQVALLSQQVETLKKDLAKAKTENAKGDEGEIKKGIGVLFEELQTNYIKMGRNPNTGISNLVIPPVAFMNRLIMFFPFLGKLKRY